VFKLHCDHCQREVRTGERVTAVINASRTLRVPASFDDFLLQVKTPLVEAQVVCHECGHGQ
jgi:hypothetical protein